MNTTEWERCGHELDWVVLVLVAVATSALGCGDVNVPEGSPVCVSGQHKCSGVSLLACNDSQSGYVHVQDCNVGQRCDAVKGVCVSDSESKVCSIEEYACNQNVIFRCNQDQDGWDFFRDCSATPASYCVSGKNTCQYDDGYCVAGQPCEDGDACSYDDECDMSGQCVPGARVTCSNDPGPCGALRTCNGTSSCSVTYPSSSTSCDDGDPCTQSDRCNSKGSCLAGSSICWFDEESGLLWENPANQSGLTSSEAESYCSQLSTGGFTNWRLPTISELRSLIRNCPATQTGGACGVTDSCNGNAPFGTCTQTCNVPACGDGSNPACFGSGPYRDNSLQGAIGWTWSSTGSCDTNVSTYRWSVNYGTAALDIRPPSSQGDVRCVRNE